MIEEIYRELKAAGQVHSSNEFSRDWLGMEESYLRCLRSKQRQPSAKVIVACARKLKDRAECLAASKMQAVSERGLQLRELSRLCLNQLLERDVRYWQ